MGLEKRHKEKADSKGIFQINFLRFYDSWEIKKIENRSQETQLQVISLVSLNSFLIAGFLSESPGVGDGALKSTDSTALLSPL